MQTISQYGFTILSENNNESEYQNIKNNIETICKKTQQICFACKIKNAIYFHFLLDKNIPLYITIKYENEQVTFGLYDRKNIYDTVYLEDLQTLFTEEKYEHFCYRIENYIKYDNYKKLDSSILKAAWNNKNNNMIYQDVNKTNNKEI